MSLYREPGRGRRVRLAGAATTLLLALLLGFAVGRLTAPEPSLADAVAELRDEAAPIVDALELVAITYGTDETTRVAAGEQLERATARFARVRPRLALLDPDGTKRARGRMDELARLVDRREEAAAVEQAAADARRAVEQILASS